VIAGAAEEVPPGYGEGKDDEGSDGICFQDWICKAFWRLGLPRGGGRRLLRQEAVHPPAAKWRWGPGARDGGSTDPGSGFGRGLAVREPQSGCSSR
jgi:hypothetical protein